MKIKKVLSLVVAIALISSTSLSSLPVEQFRSGVITAAAWDEDEVKQTSAGLRYVIEDDAVTIVGYTGSSAKLTIPSSIGDKDVTVIDYNAFENCKTLTSVIVPASVKTIRSSAFAGCTKLKSIDLGKVERLGSYLFQNTQIKEVTVPNTVIETEYGGVFAESPVEKVVFEDGIADIPDCICYNASSLKEVVMPEKEDNLDGYVIGDYAFANTSLTALDIPESVTEIGEGAYQGCAKLTSIKVPDGVKAIGSYAFSGCKRLTSADLGKPQTLGSYILEKTQVKEITIPNTVKEGNYGGVLAESSVEKVTFEKGISKIPNFVCYNAKSVKEVVMPEMEDNLDGYVIEEYAFSNTALTSVTIPESVTEIGDGAFQGCEKLTSIKVPDGVKAIGSYAFSGCKRLTSAYLGKPQKLGAYILEKTQVKEVTIPNTVEEGNFGGVLAESSVEKVTFEEGISKIPNFVCYNAKSVKEVVMPEMEDNLDGYVIEEYAFANTLLTSVKIPESVTEIGDGAFQGCEKLTSVKVPDGVKAIGSHAFSGCKRLVNIDLGKPVKLGNRMFGDCISLDEVTVPSTVTESNYGGVFTDSSVTTVRFGDGMKKVPDYIAADSPKLRFVYLPESVTAIGSYSFGNCPELENIYSNKAALDFESDSVNGCKKLDDARFRLFDPTSTYLAVNSEQVSRNGIVNYTVKYKLLNKAAHDASDIWLHLNIPEELTLIPDSIISDMDIEEEEFVNGSFRTDSSEGEVKFSARVTEPGDYQVSAYLNFYYNNSYWEQDIGTLDVDCPGLTIACSDTVNDFSADIYGFADKGKSVKIYVNDTEAGTLETSNYTGKYSGTIKLPKGEEGDTYSLYAVCGDEKSDTITVTYSVAKPVITNIILRYNIQEGYADEMDITEVFLTGKSPVVSFNPAYPMAFEITATNSDRIQKMFVTSKKAGIIKYIEAVYDPEKGKWVAEGYFDEYNPSYVPGALNISITEIKDMVIEEEKTDRSEYETFTNVPDEIKENSTVNFAVDTDHEKIAELNVSNGKDSAKSYIYYSDNNEGTYIDGNYCTAKQISADPIKYGFIRSPVTTYENGHKVEYYTYYATQKDVEKNSYDRLSDFYSDAGTLLTGGGGAIILKKALGDNEALNKGIDIIHAFAVDGAADYLESIGKIGAASYLSTVGTVFSVASDFSRYLGQMERAHGDPQLQSAYTACFAIRMAGTIAGVCLPFPVGTIVSVGTSLLMDYFENRLDMYGVPGCLRFIVDPSGIVYEGDIEHPIEGAVVTIYYKDPDTGKAVKWNAEDYDQINPIITGADGSYLWDVPEGEWQVVAQKDGYTVFTTDWMTIPPVRTEVNIPLNGLNKKILGDLNNDNVINVSDIAKLAAHVKGVKSLDEASLERADINGDKSVNVSDIAIIAAHVKGIKRIA